MAYTWLGVTENRKVCALLSCSVLVAVCVSYVIGGRISSKSERPISTPLANHPGETPPLRDLPISIVPLCGGILDVPKERVTLLSSRLALKNSPTLSELLHAMPVFGSETSFMHNKGGDRVRALDVLLNADTAEKVFGVPTFQVSRYGARFAVVDPKLLGTNQKGAESHPGQALAVLAGMGVPLVQPIKLAGDRTVALQMVLDDLKANFVLEGEIFWDAVALALYVPPIRTWKNKFGQEFTFDQLTEELLRRHPGESACGGTHRLITLTVIIMVDDQQRILSQPTRERVLKHLAEVGDVLMRIQQPNGAWDVKWVEALPGATKSQQMRVVNDTERVMVTGHHLEWLILLPEGLRPKSSSIIRAAEWLLSTSLHLSEDPGWVHEWYCPVSHAAKVIRHLSGRRITTRGEKEGGG